LPYQTLTLERDDHVATLTLNRPDRMNSFDSRMREELPVAWEEIAQDEGIWAVILTGAGDRAFCAGMDLREPLPASAAEKGTQRRTQLTALDCEVGKPVITAVNGVCAGGGLAFVADSDIVIASESATFTDGRTSAGQVSIHGTLRLARKIPLEAVFRLVLLGRAERMDAQRAFQLGMVSEVVAGPRLMERAQALARAIVGNSPSAVFYSRHAIWKSLDLGLHDALEMGWNVVTDFAHHSPDAAEGARAFVEKRPAQWTYAPPPGRRRR
jgi:enoyl-CoA hydratase/carnithine racemase